MLNKKDFLILCSNSHNVDFYQNFIPITESVFTLQQSERNEFYREASERIEGKGTTFSLTLGPLLKRHKFNVDKKLRYKHWKDVEDIRAGKFSVLHPGETITVLTNEFVSLDSKTLAIILPRLSLANQGVDTISTYIETYWQGILQITLTNNSVKPIKLDIGTKIAVCFFFELSSPVDITYKETFPRTSHHFGQNWDGILNNVTDPFPVKNGSTTTSGFDKICTSVSNFLNKAKDLFVKYSGPASVVAISASIALHLNSVSEIKEDIKKIITTGSITYELKKVKNKSELEKAVDIETLSGDPIILATTDNKNVTVFPFIKEKSGNKITKIGFAITAKAHLKEDISGKIQWALLK